MQVSLDQLISAVRASTKKLTVLVPSSDYYAREGDSEKKTISYVNPDQLIEALKKLNNPHG